MSTKVEQTTQEQFQSFIERRKAKIRQEMETKSRNDLERDVVNSLLELTFKNSEIKVLKQVLKNQIRIIRIAVVACLVVLALSIAFFVKA